MTQKSKELFEIWNRNSLCYIHWKGNNHLQEGLDGHTDLDVLLSPKDKDKGSTILREIGFLHVCSQYGSRYPNVEDWIGFDESTGCLLHLHLHYALMSGHTGMKEYELPWMEEALNTRVQDRDTHVYMMNPNLELVSLYTRLILKSQRKWGRAARKGKYKLDNHFFVEINYIKKCVNWDEVRDIAIRYFGDKSDDFITILSSTVLSSSQYLRLYSIVMDRMRDCSRYHGLSLWVRRTFYSVVVPGRSLLRKRYGWRLFTHKIVNSNRGLMIALIGQDGAGKSTISKDIEKWLTWKLEARQFYLGSGEHFNPWEKRLSNKLVGKKGMVWKLIKNILSFRLVKKIADNAHKNVCNAKKYAEKGGIALLDRFPQLEYAGVNDGPKIRSSVLPKVNNRIGRWIVNIYADREEKILRKAVRHHPDIVFKLILSPEESIKRKPQENYESVKRKHEIIKQLKFPQSHVYEVDATVNYNDELLYIKNLIWRHM